MLILSIGADPAFVYEEHDDYGLLHAAASRGSYYPLIFEIPSDLFRICLLYN